MQKCINWKIPVIWNLQVPNWLNCRFLSFGIRKFRIARYNFRSFTNLSVGIQNFPFFIKRPHIPKISRCKPSKPRKLFIQSPSETIIYNSKISFSVHLLNPALYPLTVKCTPLRWICALSDFKQQANLWIVSNSTPCFHRHAHCRAAAPLQEYAQHRQACKTLQPAYPPALQI